MRLRKVEYSRKNVIRDPDSDVLTRTYRNLRTIYSEKNKKEGFTFYFGQDKTIEEYIK